MICNAQEYNAGAKELGLLIEQEGLLDAAGLRPMSDLANALVAFERDVMEKQG